MREAMGVGLDFVASATVAEFLACRRHCGHASTWVLASLSAGSGHIPAITLA